MPIHDTRMMSVLDGSIGQFWPCGADGEPSSEPLAGYVRKSQHNQIELEVLTTLTLDEFDEIAINRKSLPSVTSCYGRLPLTSTLLIDPGVHSGKWRIGGGAASVETYRFNGVATNVPLDTLNSTRCLGVSASFPHIQFWANMDTVQVVHKFHEGKSVATEYKLQSDLSRQESRFSPSLTVWCKPAWQVKQGNSEILINKSIDIGIDSSKSVPPRELIGLLVTLRRLLSVMHQRDVCADRSTIRLDTSEAARSCPMWHADLNTPHENALDSSGGDVTSAYARLQHIGGLDGVARWLRLATTYPRLIEPVIREFETGIMPASIELAQLCQAAEYAVATAQRRSRTTAWTKQGKSRIEKVALTLGKPFDDWCGDTPKWSAIVWSVYNGIKHDPLDEDIQRVAILAAGTRIMMTAHLLRRISKNTESVRTFLANHRTNHIREATRELVANSPMPAKTAR